MTGLYDLTKTFRRIMDMADEGILDQEELQEALMELDDEVEVVAEGCAKMISELECNNAAIALEIQRLEKKKKENAANMETIKKSLEKFLTTMKKEKFKTPLYSFGIQNNPPKLVVDKPELIPVEYLIPQPAKADSAKIKNFLKTAGSCDWAHLEQTRSLRIR